MHNIAIIKDGVVENTIVVTEEDRAATSLYYQTRGYVVVNNATAGPGDLYNAGVFTRPAAVPATSKDISGLAYLRRFTQAQRIAIRARGATDPVVQDLLHLLDSTIAQGGVINLLDPDTIAGAHYLAGVLPEQGIDPATVLA